MWLRSVRMGSPPVDELVAHPRASRPAMQEGRRAARSGTRFNEGVPELPEVETVRRQPEPEPVGRTLEGAETVAERFARPEPPSETEEALVGRTIESLDRRGKFPIV